MTWSGAYTLYAWALILDWSRRRVCLEAGCRNALVALDLQSALRSAHEFSSEPASVSPTRVFLLLENRLLREALARLLRGRADLLVVASLGREECSPDDPLVDQCDVMIFDYVDTAWLPANLSLKARGGVAPEDVNSMSITPSSFGKRSAEA